MKQADVLLQMTGLEKHYGDTRILQGIDLIVHAGDFLAITGPSGAGKSTLLGIMGLLESFEAGDYAIRGRSVRGLGDAEASRLRNKTFGFVFQMFHLLPELTAWENVARPLVYAGVRRRQRRERAMQLLEWLGLKDRAEHRPAELSGGEQQRVAIARALANDPEVILADEPTGNLPESQWIPILQALQELNERGKTVVVVTHDPNVARWATNSIELRNGRMQNESQVAKRES